MLKICLALSCLLLFSPNLTLANETAAEDAAKYENARKRMVRAHIRSAGIMDEKVIRAMASVPRHLFVPKRLAGRAYRDHPLPIGEGQTISQPYIVALMTEALKLAPDMHILEVGTGSGYQAAILSKIVRKVTTIEIKKKLHLRASKVLDNLGYDNVETVHGDGYFGWGNHAPYDGIMITAAVNHIPPPLLNQLKDGARLILPLGNPFSSQYLVLVTKKGDDFITKTITGVIFVPLTGHALDRDR